MARAKKENEQKEDKLTFAIISTKFHLPLQQAASEFGLSKSSLQRRCRRVGVKQWPFRKVMAIIKTKPNYSSTELDEILSHVRKSPEVANKITDLPLSECTMDNFVKLVSYESERKSRAEEVIRLPSVQELLSRCENEWGKTSRFEPYPTSRREWWNVFANQRNVNMFRNEKSF